MLHPDIDEMGLYAERGVVAPGYGRATPDIDDSGTVARGIRMGYGGIYAICRDDAARVEGSPCTTSRASR